MTKAPTFGERLYEFRKRVALTQRQLAQAMGVDFTYISKIESGGAPPPARDRIERAVPALKLSPEEADELYQLAAKVPTDVTALFASHPAAFRLFRSIRQAPARDQEALIEDLIRKAEEQHKKKPGAGK